VVRVVAEALAQQPPGGQQRLAGGLVGAGRRLLGVTPPLRHLLDRQPRPEEGDRGAQRPGGQAQGAVDDLRPAAGVAVLLLDDRLANQRPVVGWRQPLPAAEQLGGPVQLAGAVVQARQPVVGRDAGWRQAQQHLGAGPGRALLARLLQLH
jgi:hypothetical protein